MTFRIARDLEKQKQRYSRDRDSARGDSNSSATKEGTGIADSEGRSGSSSGRSGGGKQTPGDDDAKPSRPKEDKVSTGGMRIARTKIASEVDTFREHP